MVPAKTGQKISKVQTIFLKQPLAQTKRIHATSKLILSLSISDVRVLIPQLVSKKRDLEANDTKAKTAQIS